MKNIITNIFGVILWLIAIYKLTTEPITLNLITSVSLLIVVGGFLFLFSNKALKDLLKSIVTSKGETLSKTIDPDREKPDTRG